MSSTVAISENEDFLSKLPNLSFVSTNKDFTKFHVVTSNHKIISVLVHYFEGYPSSPCQIQLSSPTIHPSVIAKLTEKCEEVALKCSIESKPQVAAIHNLLETCLRANKLVLCSEEIRELQALIKECPCDSLTLNQSAGSVNIEVNCNHSVLNFTIKVPHNYPREQVSVTCMRSNFPASVNYMFFKQAEEVARRCALGIELDKNLQSCDPCKPSEKELRLTTSMYRNDLKFLKKMQDIATESQTKNIKRERKMLVKKEVEAEFQQMQKTSDVCAQFANCFDVDKLKDKFGHPSLGNLMKNAVGKPSLFLIGSFLVTKLGRFLPKAHCVSCGDLLSLPEKGEQILVGSELTADDPSVPRRSYCGHWFHDGCLEKELTNYPFGVVCPSEGCPGRVFHPKYPTSIEVVQRRYAAQKAKDREMEQMMDFFDL
eukprot:Platyproteum_vivax@DN6180_c0_g1_i1.p1